MTREQAKDFKWFASDRQDIHAHIDKIFDDIESRTCANCTYNKSGVCYNSMVELMNSEKILVADEFGCNRWESRDE